MGAEKDGCAVEEGLEHVVAADVVDVAAADNGEARVGVADGELAHGVDEEDFFEGLGVCEPGEGDVFAGEELGDFVEPLGMAGREDEKIVLEEVEEELLFVGMGAAEGDGGLREGEGLGNGLRLQVEFEVAGDVEAGRVYEGLKVVEVVLVLNADVVKSGEEVFGKNGRGFGTVWQSGQRVCR